MSNVVGLSPCIKACYTLQGIHQAGVYRVSATKDPNCALFCDIERGATNPPTVEIMTLGVELFELRSRLMMTKVPQELIAEFNMQALVDNFVMQLLSDVKDVAIKLFSLDYSRTTPPSMVLQADLAGLREILADWMRTVDRTRTDHCYLNFFKMAELLPPQAPPSHRLLLQLPHLRGSPLTSA
jgi:hypothetical protein